jgi:hypothetical protein
MSEFSVFTDHGSAFADNDPLDTNLQQIKIEPNSSDYNLNENNIFESNEEKYNPPGSDTNIKTEPEDTAADFSESSSNLHHLPFASIDNENLQDEDELQNELTSELIIKSEHECSDVEQTQDNGHYTHGK